MKLILFGTGKCYDFYKPYFANHNIVALLDNDKKKQGTFKDDIPILAPKEIKALEYDAVYIVSNDYCDEMYGQLVDLHVSENKIFSYEQIGMSLPSIAKQPLTIYNSCDYYSSLLNKRVQHIALITFDLAISGGAGLGFLWTAAILHKYSDSYAVHLISRCDGALRDNYLKLGIPVIIDPNLYVETLADIEYKNCYDLMFFNTIHFANIFLKPSDAVPTIWWIHDSNMIYNGHVVEYLNDVKQGNISVYAVADLAQEAFHCRCPNWHIKRLSYGVEDRYEPIDDLSPHSSGLIFAAIGWVSKRKAQDIFLQAIKLLPSSVRKRCLFWIIGNNQSDFAQKITRLADDIPEVTVFGEVSADTLHKLYRKISVLVCASREDPMPGVCVEAMMYYHPCIVSDNTGISGYITDEFDGLICRAGDAQSLKQKLIWFVDNAEKIPQMGHKARKIYERYFSFEQFENNLLDVIEKELQRNQIADPFL